ncbi:hypothetical protein PIROE2DRAFT_7750 [Piromyces sp. E2]|nr:hypothetical protein PIROE2DRAFT_7750 [Piromyces sp. E2]|eukprot:OUM65287.1 hypothetical protein PIROE2DRAFT_7750 [Piromyces sp. E2]
MPKVPSSKSFLNSQQKEGPSLPIPPIPPFINNVQLPIPSLSNKNMSEQVQLFHQQHFSQPAFPIGQFMPLPFHPSIPTLKPSAPAPAPASLYRNIESINYGENMGEEVEGKEEEEKYDENEEEEEEEEEEMLTTGGNPNNISFVLSKETIEMFRHSELYRQKLKEEREQEEERRLQKEKEEERRRQKIYQEHNKGYEEHLETYGDFKLKFLEDTLNEDFKKQNTGELWPILPLNEITN